MKLLTKKGFNSRAMEMVFRNIWRLDKGVVIHDLVEDFYAFQFFSKTDKDMVFKDGPWSFDGKLLLFPKSLALSIPHRSNLIQPVSG